MPLMSTWPSWKPLPSLKWRVPYLSRADWVSGSHPTRPWGYLRAVAIARSGDGYNPQSHPARGLGLAPPHAGAAPTSKGRLIPPAPCQDYFTQSGALKRPLYD